MSAAVMTVVFLVGYYGITCYLLRGVKIQTRDLCVAGVMIALTLILDSIRFPLPTGATISCASMVPLMLLAVLLDYRLAILSGWACGILAVFAIPAWQPVHWAQILVEHMICFSCLGYAGIFGSSKRWKLLCGILIASVLKICGHLLSGVIFFSQNAWEGWGAWGYSLMYNISQNIPLCLLSGAIVLALPLRNLKRAVRKD